MTLDIFINAVIASLISSGLVAFGLKKWVKHSFQIQIAKVEAQIRFQALEHQVRFTRFDNQVALAIEGAYGLICAYSESIVAAVKSVNEKGMDIDQELASRPEQLAKEFFTFMQRNAIYLPADINKKMHVVRLGMRDAFSEELSEYHNRLTQKSALVSPALSGIFRSTVLQTKCDELMFDLQEVLQKHLSRFVQPI